MLGAVVAAIMAASFFMPWIVWFGEPVTPQLLLEDGIQAVLEGPWQILAFLGSFAVAALAVLVSVMGSSAGLLMLIAGAIPFGLIAYQIFSLTSEVEQAGFQMPDFGDPAGALEAMLETFEIGAIAYFACAALLVVIGLGRLMRGS